MSPVVERRLGLWVNTGALAFLAVLFVFASPPPALAQGSCSCSFGAYLGGYPIPPEDTFCGFVACGGDNHFYVCETGGWRFVDGTDPCNLYNVVPSCTCFGGQHFGGLPIPPGETYCGYTACGTDDHYFVCEPSGWRRVSSSSPCSTDHHKLGVNTAMPYSDPNGNPSATANHDRAAGLGMGYYLEINTNQFAGEGIVRAMSSALARGLTPIMRLCVDSTPEGDGNYPCDFANASTFVNHIRGIDDLVNGIFYVIAGANEPDKEMWIAGEDQGWIDDDGFLSGAEINAVGAANAGYMNSVISGLNGRTIRTGGQIGLLSPAFDCLNVNTEPIIEAMANNGAAFNQLDGLAVNGYNVDGQKASHYVTQCQSFFRMNGIQAPISNVFVTETGMLEIERGQASRTQALINMRDQYLAFKANPTVRAFLLFDAFDTNPFDFTYNVLQDDAEWDYLRGGKGIGNTSCSCTGPGVTNNFCHHAPRTTNCPMTFPGGYCDPNGNSQYEDADWNLGFFHYLGNC